MKNNLVKILILSGLVLLSACNKFLEVEVLGKSDTETFFSELDGLRAALPGAYRVTYNFYDGEFLKYGDVAGNMVRMSSVASGVDMVNQYNFMSDPTQEVSAVGYLWKRGFIVMSNVNNILEYAPNLKKSYPHDIDEINNIMAQAYFLRALVHFNLVLCYAQPYNYTPEASHWGVPVLTRVPSANEPVLRKTVNETYNQILNDLNSALNTFTSDYQFNAYYASPLACKALLARVYQYMGKWDLAEQYAAEVIGVKPLTPYGSYVNMYANNEVGTEAIFRLSGYDAGKSTSNYYKYGQALEYPADTLYSLFTDSRDVRIKLLYYKPDKKIGKVCMKYYLQNNTDAKAVTNPFVLRTSEMYLIRAEAYVHQNLLDKAVKDIKTLESRALGVSESEVNLPYSTAADVDKLLEIESIKELCFEGHRFFDIARQNKSVIRESNTNSVVRRLIYPDYRYALPIPLVEREANPKIQQNEGY